jgi:hypothetical protein
MGEPAPELAHRAQSFALQVRRAVVVDDTVSKAALALAASE